MWNLTERDAKAIFLHLLNINNPMNSVPQTNNRPINLTPKSNKNEMVSYPEYYYKEIVEFLRNSNSYYQ